MKRTIFSTLFLSLLFLQVQAQIIGRVYSDPNIREIVREHKKIAILPLAVTMQDTRPMRKKRVAQEDLDKMALGYETAYQRSMYSWFLRRKHRRKKAMGHVRIQDIDETNRILNENGILTSEDLAKYSKDDVMQMLGVDVLFGGNVRTETTFNRTAAAVIDVFTQVGVPTSESEVFIKMWDDREGEVIWSFGRIVNGSYTTDADRMVHYLMRRVSKRFPYKKKYMKNKRRR